jgi:curved DNA-binding protein CbpA
MENKLEKILKEMNNENLYKILHIEKTEDPEILKKGYKKMVRIYHPDKNKNKNSLEIFGKVQKAYEILKDVELKALYDSYLDRKLEKVKKYETLNKERKKFANELIKREEEHQKNKSRGNNKSDVTSSSSAKYRRDDLNSTLVSDNKPPVKKTFEEKLKNSGIKIKWGKDLPILITKETINSYFKDYGTIEETICKPEANKAFVLFAPHVNINQTYELILQNKALTQLFKIKKVSKKAIPEENNYDYEKFKSSYVDSSTLNMIKNMKMMNNVEFLNKIQKTENSKTVNTSSNTTTKTINTDNKIDMNLNLEDFEKAAFEKLKMMTKNK